MPEDYDADGASLVSCEIGSVVAGGEMTGIYDPFGVRRHLLQHGFVISDGDSEKPKPEVPEPDEDTILAEHALRVFMRATQINEEVFRQKFGTRASQFFSDVLPRMIEAGILAEVPYKGGGRQGRYKLCIPMSRIDQAVPARVKELDEFLGLVMSGD